MKTMKSFLLFPLLFLLISAAASRLSAGEIDRHFRKTFEVQEGFTLHLMHGDGDVQIIPWEKNRVDVEVVYRADATTIGLGDRPDFNVEFRKSFHTVHIIGRETGGDVIGFHSINRHEYRYTIKAPPYMEVESEGDDGDVRISGWRNDIDLVLDDGDVALKDISAGSLRIRLDDGDIALENISGKLQINGDDGDVRITASDITGGRIILDDGDVRLRQNRVNLEINGDDGDILGDRLVSGELHIRTGDGDVELALLKHPGMDVEINTDDGRVQVSLERGVSVAYRLESHGGDIETSLGRPSGGKASPKRVSGEIHGGNGRLVVRTGDGDIILHEDR